jgi:hypothetical protein
VTDGTSGGSAGFSAALHMSPYESKQVTTSMVLLGA